MKAAIYGKAYDVSFSPFINELFNRLEAEKAEVHIYAPFAGFLKQQKVPVLNVAGTFGPDGHLNSGFDLLISVGGDGTFLEAVSLITGTSIPVIGINTGRLGFLANISGTEISNALEALFRNEVEYEERSVLEVHTPQPFFGPQNFALNELSIQKRGAAMITIHAFINNEFLNAYWADGLIISTPTGSTAYSMSTGGPILAPDCRNLIVTPIAAHNLTVRPLVIRDDAELLLRVSGRDTKYLLSADHRSLEVPMDTEVKLKRAGFIIRMIRLPDHDFFNTLRNKLMWGVDKRN